jgi:hypothetical protein
MIFIHHPLIFYGKGSKLSKSQSPSSVVFNGALFQKTTQIIGVKEYHMINNYV